MHIADIIIFILYMVGMLSVGVWFLKKNKSTDDYYVSGRNMGSWHIGLSVVATDVGGGFSIGLGGLGFTMGLSGSWMLFTGLVGAWLSAVLLIPRVSRLGAAKKLTTFPQLFGQLFNRKVALVAGIISAIGYLGFTSSQILAGAKLASATIPSISIDQALLIMGVIAVVYTAIGGMKAVIYTDTIQWIILMCGLVLIGIPFAWNAVGGYETISTLLAPEFLSLTEISWKQILNWSATIIPIWFVGMTLYQRIYACRDEKTAKKAWFIAGLFEWPLMAFMGVLLGMLARVAWMQGMFSGVGFGADVAMDPEMGLPFLLSHIMPTGILGLMMCAYLSAILSTADSCLMAASGNVVTDIIGRFFTFKNSKNELRASQVATLILGSLALILSTVMSNVLELMLYSYAFMVSGLFVPVLGGLFWNDSTPAGALAGMIAGGTTTLLLIWSDNSLPFGFTLPEGIDANIYGILICLLVFIGVSKATGHQLKPQDPVQ